MLKKNYFQPISNINLIFFIGGIALSFQYASLPQLSHPLLWLLLLIGLCSIIGLGKKWTTIRWHIPIIWALLFFTAGLSYAVWRAEYRLTNTIPNQLLEKTVTIEGEVIRLSPARYNRTQFDFKIDTLQTAQQTHTLNIIARLNDYHRDTPPLAAIKNGTRLRFKARLRQPNAFFNPHGFDYAAYLFANNIRLRGYVRQRDTLKILAAPSPTPRQIVRQRLLAKKDINYATLLALTIGDKQHLSQDQYDTLRQTGTAHLISISGTHIGFVFLFISLLIHWLWRRYPKLILRCPAHKAAMLLALPVALAYALMAGFTIPTQRSFYMLTMTVLLFIFGRQMSTLTILLLVMTGIVIIDPWSLISPGFWLSFALTAVVIAVHHRQSSPPTDPTNPNTKRISLIKQLFIMQCYVSLLAMPLTLWFFNEASIVSPLANFFAVPWVGSVVLPLAFLGMFTDIWHPAHWALIVLWQYIEFLAQWSFAAWSPAQAPWWVFILAIAGAAIIIMPVGIPMRWIGTLPIAVLFSWQNLIISDGKIKIVALDVGQGTAIALHTANTTQIYDTGPPIGGVLLRQYLRAKGVLNIDRLIISHNDYDHRGGVPALTAFFPQTKTMASDGHWQCTKGTTWQHDNVKFTVLHPPPTLTPSPTNTATSNNDKSCVIYIETAEGLSILLTGDISSEIEEQLLQSIKKVDIIFIAHHGSRFSTSQQFLQTVQPSIAVITVGNNTYGHPHASVLKKLRQNNIQIYRTDTMGAIILELGKTINIRTTRENQLRYWH